MDTIVADINVGLASPHGIIDINDNQLTITSTWNDADGGDNLTEDSGTVFFNGTAQNLPDETWYSLKLGDPSADTTYTLPADTTINNDIVFEENGILNSGGHTLYIARHWDDNGSEDNFTEGVGEVQFNGTVQQNIDTYGTSSETFNNLVITNTGVGVIVLAQGKMSINGNLTIYSGELDLGAGFVGGSSHSIGGYAYIDNGTLDLNTSSITITGLTRIGNSTTSGLLDMTDPALGGTDDPDLTAMGGVEISSTGTLNVTGSSAVISCNGNWTNSGTFNAGNSKVLMTGSGKTINASGTGDFYNLEIWSPATMSLGTNIGVTNDIIVTSGTFDVVTYTVTAAGNISNSDTVSIGTASTAGTLDLEGDFTGGTLAFVSGGGSQLNFAGSSFSPATLNTNDGTIVFDSTSSSQSIPSYTYNNLTIDKGAQIATAIGNLTIDGTLTISGGRLGAHRRRRRGGLLAWKRRLQRTRRKGLP
jgi:hypothetical protein